MSALETEVSIILLTNLRTTAHTPHVSHELQVKW